MNRTPDCAVRPAPADVAGHGVVDVRVRRPLAGRQQCDRRHDLPGLAVAALRNLLFHPGLLYRVTAIGREAFDRRDIRPLDAAYREQTRPDRLAVQKDRARSALADTTPELRSRELQRLAQDPKQRIAPRDVHLPSLSVEGELRHD